MANRLPEGFRPLRVYLKRMNKLAYLVVVLASSAESLVPSARDFSLRPVTWTILGGRAPRDVASGRAVPITLQATIANGWHIYSLSQKPGGPIPLRLALLGAADVIVRGVIVAPRPERMFDRNFGIETELYSGRPRFTIPIGVPAHSLTGIRKFKIGARYQACSDKLCLPPRTDTLDVALRIASRQ